MSRFWDRFWIFFGWGFVGSLIFYWGSSLLGGSPDTAYASSAIGFWLAVTVGFFRCSPLSKEIREDYS